MKINLTKSTVCWLIDNLVDDNEALRGQVKFYEQQYSDALEELAAAHTEWERQKRMLLDQIESLHAILDAK